MDTRRPALAVLVAVVLAGCVGGAPGPASPASPTATGDDCTQEDRTAVDPVRADVTPSPYPDRPAAWDESAVRDYVVAFEEAWARNEHLRAGTKRVEVLVADVTVRQVDGGYRVDLVSRTNTWHGGLREDDETATVVHGDGPRIPVAYHLSDRRLVRAAGDHRVTPTVGPTAGRTVRCFG